MEGIVTAAACWKTLKKIDAHPLSCYVDLSAILPDYVRVYGIAGTRSLLRRFGADRLPEPGRGRPCGRASSFFAKNRQDEQNNFDLCAGL